MICRTTPRAPPEEPREASVLTSALASALWEYLQGSLEMLFTLWDFFPSITLSCLEEPLSLWKSNCAFVKRM